MAKLRGYGVIVATDRNARVEDQPPCVLHSRTQSLLLQRERHHLNAAQKLTSPLCAAVRLSGGSVPLRFPSFSIRHSDNPSPLSLSWPLSPIWVTAVCTPSSNSYSRWGTGSQL